MAPSARRETRRTATPIDRWRHARVAGAFLSMCLVAGPVRAQCPNVPADGNRTDIEGFLLADGWCTENGEASDNWLPNGGYMRIDTALAAHSWAETSGKCYWGRFVWPPGYCDVWPNPELRTVNHINIVVDPPTVSPTTHSVWAFKPGTTQTEYRQHVDTREPGTTSGPIVQEGFPTVGKWDFRFASVINTTNCSIQPSQSEIKEKSVYAVECLPVFAAVGDGPINRVPTDGELKISVPSGPLTIAVGAGNSGWTTGLGSAGMPVNIVTGACAPASPYCVQVEVRHPPNNPMACAETQRGGAGPDGVTTIGSKIFVHPTHTGWSQNYLNWLMNHEMGHLFGLRNTNNCAENGKTVMDGNEQTPVPCGTFPASYSPTPTPSDALAAARTPYGDGPRKMCGIVP